MIKQIFNEIKLAEKVLIVSHVNPDGDTLGSMCALKLFIGEKADMLIQLPTGKTYPEVYKFLPNIDKAKTLETVEDIYDLIITVDVAAIDRIVANARKIFDKCKTTVNIDHHKTNNNFAKLNYVLGGHSSTGEVLYEMFEHMGIKLSKEMADCLYVSILTDTGCFKYESTSAKTLVVASKLVELGVDNSDIAQKCYDFKSKAMVMFQASVISNAKFEMSNRVSYAIITDKIMDKFKAKNEHTEGIAEALRAISTVEISAVLKEDNGVTKVSLRSKKVDVTPVVTKFNGGGHIHAAGCTIRKPVSTALELLLKEIKECLK